MNFALVAVIAGPLLIVGLTALAVSSDFRSMLVTDSRDLHLLFGELSFAAWFWPSRLRQAFGYSPRHAKARPDTRQWWVKL